MAAPIDQNQHSVVSALVSEHAERTPRFQDNLARRPRDCDPSQSFETKWAFSVAESKRATVEKKTSNQLATATMTISFALTEVGEEITEIDALLQGVDKREHELDSMTSSLDKMCLTLTARSTERKRIATQPAAPASAAPAAAVPAAVEESPLKTAIRGPQTTVTSSKSSAGPTSNVSTAAEDFSAVERAPTVPGEQGRPPSAAPSQHFDQATAPKTPANSSTFDYSALSAYTPGGGLDSTFTCPRTEQSSRSSRSNCSVEKNSERRA